MAITPGDIRARFETAMALYEAAREFYRPWFENTYNAYIRQIRYSGTIIKAKTGESLRADFGEDPAQMFANMMIDAGMSPDAFVVNLISPGEAGSKSGQFSTLELLIQKDQVIGNANFKRGEAYYIVNRASIKGGVKAAVGKKDLSPDKLGLTKNEYTTVSQLISLANGAVSRTSLPDNYKQFLNELMTKIASQTSYAKYDSMTKLVESNSTDFTVNLGEDLVAKYSIDSVSMNNIANDFGEILGGVFLFSMVKNAGVGVSYPTQSNAALVDFMFDGWKVSSKAGKRGGVPSIGALAHAVLHAHRQGDISVTNTELELIQNVFEVLENPTKHFKESDAKRSSDVYSTFVALANNYVANTKSGYDFFLSASGLNGATFTRASVCSFLDKAYNDGTLWPVLSEYFKKTNTVPRGFENENNAMKTYGNILKDDNRFGIIFYPLTKEVVEELNARYSRDLSTLVNQVSTVQQLYLITAPKATYVKFKIKSFDTANFKFVAGASAPTPLNKNIAIESL
jgi:hypothetical protein